MDGWGWGRELKRRQCRHRPSLATNQYDFKLPLNALLFDGSIGLSHLSPPSCSLSIPNKNNGGIWLTANNPPLIFGWVPSLIRPASEARLVYNRVQDWSWTIPRFKIYKYSYTLLLVLSHIYPHDVYPHLVVYLHVVYIQCTHLHDVYPQGIYPCTLRLYKGRLSLLRLSTRRQFTRRLSTRRLSLDIRYIESRRWHGKLDDSSSQSLARNLSKHSTSNSVTVELVDTSHQTPPYHRRSRTNSVTGPGFGT